MQKVRVLVAQLCLTLWPHGLACQAPLSMDFSRQEYWSWLPFPSPEGRPSPGIEPESPALQVDFLSSEPPGKRLPKLEQGSTLFCQSAFSQVGAESVILNKAFLWGWYLVGWHFFFFLSKVKWVYLCFSSSACSFRETFWVWYAFITAFSEVSNSDLHHVSKAITVNFNRNKLIRMPVKNTAVNFSCCVFVCQYQILNSRHLYLLTEIRIVEICHHNCIWTKQNAIFWTLNQVERWVKSLIYLSEVILKRFFAKAWRKNI